MPHSGYNIETIRQLLRAQNSPLADRVLYFAQIDSTNSYLMRRPDLPCGTVCLADYQTAGRGRRGRNWRAPVGSSIMLSVAWNRSAVYRGGLSLLAGLVVVETLDELDLPDVGLKWPNDVLLGEAKLAGVLIEAAAERAVIGIGINVDLGRQKLSGVNQPWTDLQTVGVTPEREQLVAVLLGRLETALQRLERYGFAAFVERWNARHRFHGRAVTVSRREQQQMHGIVRGVDATGALMLEAGGRMEYVHSANVSLRLQPAAGQ